MKRLQFRHNNEVFQNRADALKYFANIVDSTNTASTIFQSSLYAEPLVAKYLDEDGNQQIILAIGVDSGLTPYHIIDSKEIAERLDANKEAIEAEVERAKDAEMALSGSIETEIARAIEAENFLSGAVETERDERIASDAVLQTQITENVAKIVPVTENLGANVREEYVLKNAKGEELGSHIKVYKDSALVGAEVNYKGATAVSQKEDGTFEFTYGPDVDKEAEYLYLIYRNENGGLSLVALDFENFLMENEEGLGIKIVDHKITIKIKNGDKYLTVTEDGLQTTAIDEVIKEAVDTLSDNLTAKIDAEIERSTAADEYISGLTAEFSAATVAEFVLANSAITLETERAMAAELYLSGAVDTEITNRENADNVLDGKILNNTDAISTLQSDHVAFSGSIISYVDNKVNGKFDEIGAADSAESKAKEYADNLNAAMSERVNALEGDNHTHTNKAELDKIVEGDKAKWDNAVSRLDNFLIGKGADEVVDTLQDIKDWMNGEGVVATELTEAIAAEAKLRSDADAALGSRITALEGINHDAYKEADNILRNEISTNINRLSGDVVSYVNNEDAKITSLIAKNEAAISVLNADKKTEGSVLYRIENEFEKSLITDGVPVTAVSPEEANKVHSLIRQITVNGEMRYYAISDATEMFYVKPRASETAPIETVNLNDYITSLETRVAALEEKLSGFAGDMGQTIKGLIKSYLVGTENEIKIAETDDKLKIGFDDNAIFGEI